MPISLILRTRRERECVQCGEAILAREQYYRKRLAPLCLGCMGVGPGSHPPRTPAPPCHNAGSHGNAEKWLKKSPRLTEFNKSTPYPVGFFYRGDVITGEFILLEVCIQADTLEEQEAVQAFLEKYGLRVDPNQR